MNYAIWLCNSIREEFRSYLERRNIEDWALKLHSKGSKAIMLLRLLADALIYQNTNKWNLKVKSIIFTKIYYLYLKFILHYLFAAICMLLLPLAYSRSQHYNIHWLFGFRSFLKECINTKPVLIYKFN